MNTLLETCFDTIFFKNPDQSKISVTSFFYILFFKQPKIWEPDFSWAYSPYPMTLWLVLEVISTILHNCPKTNQRSSGLEPISTTFHSTTSDYRSSLFGMIQTTAAKRHLTMPSSLSSFLLSVCRFICLYQSGSYSYSSNPVVLGSCRKLKDAFLRAA